MDLSAAQPEKRRRDVGCRGCEFDKWAHFGSDKRYKGDQMVLDKLYGLGPTGDNRRIDRGKEREEFSRIQTWL